MKAVGTAWDTYPEAKKIVMEEDEVSLWVTTNDDVKKAVKYIANFGTQFDSWATLATAPGAGGPEIILGSIEDILPSPQDDLVKVHLTGFYLVEDVVKNFEERRLRRGDLAKTLGAGIAIYGRMKSDNLTRGSIKSFESYTKWVKKYSKIVFGKTHLYDALIVS